MNPCSFTLPCKTFAGAFVKTDAGGEISVMNSAAYGALNINKSITINGEGNLAGSLSGGGVTIIVNAASTDKVILRNIQLNGAGGGTVGVQVLAGNVTIDNCFIYGFTTGFIGGMGVMVSTSANSYVDIRNTNISYSTFGLYLSDHVGGLRGCDA